MNPFLKRQQKQGIGGVGRLSEAKRTKALGGKQTPVSGAMQGAKGDIRLPGFLMEAKSTVSASMSLKLDWVLKIEHEAVSVGRTPALSVAFTDGTGRAVRGGAWVMIREQDFQQLVEAANVQTEKAKGP